MLSFRIIISAIKRAWIALALSRRGVCFEVYAAHPSGVIRAQTCGADRKKRDGELLTRWPRCLDAKLGANRRDETDLTLR